MNPGPRELTLRQVADRLLVLTQTLRREHGIPEEVLDELAAVSGHCVHVHATVECALESLEFFRSWFDHGLERLRRECPATPRDDLRRLRPDAEGRYGWDRWQARAIEAGLNQELAQLGRAVMREAVQHSWDPELQLECGWTDAGQTMLELALRDGPAVQKRWTYLLETDGLRGRWTAHGDWQPFAEGEL